MHEKRKVTSSSMMMMMLLFLMVFSSTFEGCFSAANQPQKNERQSKSMVTNRFGSSVVFPVTGNVYPKGYYHVTLDIGNPPKPYILDVDTGSDLTWLQCDAPCTKCTPAPHTLYKPHKNPITCKDPLCASLHWPAKPPCKTPDEQCDYEVEYADHGSSLGVLVKDSFALRFTNGSVVRPHLVFGCGYHQEVPDSIRPPYTDGVLGLGDGKMSIVSQLHDLGLTQNMVGHCLSGKGGGFLFVGDDLVPSSGIVWAPMLRNSLDKYHSLGPAELLYGGRSIGVKSLPIVFDSGSTYSYFNSQVYNATISMVKKDLYGKLKDAAEDRSLPVCWKGTKPFKSIHDVKNYFKPLVLGFTNAKNIHLELPPEAYLIITEHGNACLGILNGTEAGLGNFNIIGDISLQDKMVIYDYKKRQIGWVPANCDRLPNLDHDYKGGFFKAFTANIGIFEEQSPTAYASSKDL